jgi:hypothetical protein
MEATHTLPIFEHLVAAAVALPPPPRDKTVDVAAAAGTAAPVGVPPRQRSAASPGRTATGSLAGAARRLPRGTAAGAAGRAGSAAMEAPRLAATEALVSRPTSPASTRFTPAVEAAAHTTHTPVRATAATVEAATARNSPALMTAPTGRTASVVEEEGVRRTPGQGVMAEVGAPESSLFDTEISHRPPCHQFYPRLRPRRHRRRPSNQPPTATRVVWSGTLLRTTCRVATRPLKM